MGTSFKIGRALHLPAIGRVELLPRLEVPALLLQLLGEAEDREVLAETICAQAPVVLPEGLELLAALAVRHGRSDLQLAL